MWATSRELQKFVKGKNKSNWAAEFTNFEKLKWLWNADVDFKIIKIKSRKLISNSIGIKYRSA